MDEPESTRIGFFSSVSLPVHPLYGPFCISWADYSAEHSARGNRNILKKEQKCDRISLNIVTS